MSVNDPRCNRSSGNRALSVQSNGETRLPNGTEWIFALVSMRASSTEMQSVSEESLVLNVFGVQFQRTVWMQLNAFWVRISDRMHSSSLPKFGDLNMISSLIIGMIIEIELLKRLLSNYCLMASKLFINLKKMSTLQLQSLFSSLVWVKAFDWWWSSQISNRPLTGLPLTGPATRWLFQEVCLLSCRGMSKTHLAKVCLFPQRASST